MQLDLKREVDQKLTTIRSLIFDHLERKIDEDGEFYWVKKHYIPGRIIDECEFLLNECAALFREYNEKNNYYPYRRFSRIVAHVRLDFIPASLSETIEAIQNGEYDV